MKTQYQRTQEHPTQHKVNPKGKRKNGRKARQRNQNMSSQKTLQMK